MYKHVIFISSTSFLYHGRFAFRKISTVVRKLMQNAILQKILYPNMKKSLAYKIVYQILCIYIPGNYLSFISQVKDQMVRLTSKWTLRLLTVGSNQVRLPQGHVTIGMNSTAAEFLLALTVLSKNAVA